MHIKKVNILGDSITWGYSPYNGEKLSIYYSKLLEKNLNLEQLNNYGINGSTLASGENGYEPMCMRYKNMVDDVDLIIVFGGINDYDPISGTPIVLGNMKESSRETVYGALKEICHGLKNKYVSTKIFFITPLKIAYENKEGKLEYKTYVKNEFNYTVENVRDAIKEVCQKYKIDVFDLYEECEITAQNFIKYLPDGWHPTEEYHTILAEKIIKFIKKNYEGE